MSIEFRPATGVGRFNAKLNGNSLQIKHRLAIVGSLGKPVTQADITQFQIAFQSLVTNSWAGKFMFQRGTVTVKPTFVLKFLTTAEEANAHFVVNLKDGAGGFESVSRDPSPSHTALGDAAPRNVSLFTGSVLQPASAANIAEDLPRIFPYYVDFIGGNIMPQTSAQVSLLMRGVAGINPQPKVYVTGYGANSNTYARTTKALLTQAGLTNVVTRISNKYFMPARWGTSSTSKMSGRTDYAKISIYDELDTQSFVSQTALHSYPAAVVHEYGHMLGLQDEYNCLSSLAAGQMVQLNLIDASEQQLFENFHYKTATPPSAKVSAGQEEFVKACARANVAVPSFGSQTTSIMASGSQFLPAHFVWIREALNTISGHNDWAIVPHA